MVKKKIDQLEAFFITETSEMLGLYEVIRTNDPRNNPTIEECKTIDEETTIVKNTWAILVALAQKHGYDRFKDVDLDLEKFYLEKIQDV